MAFGKGPSQWNLRVRDAEHALEVKQARDERDGRQPQKHLDKLREIREREVGKQRSGWGGSSDVMKEVT
jgi:hypothetical protein